MSIKNISKNISLGRIAARMVLGTALVTGIYLLALQFSDNMHEVIPGEMYRSAQLNITSLDSYQRTYGIRTILNLRGDNTGSAWYDAEKRFAATRGLTMVDFRMSSKRELNQPQVQQLIALMRAAPKPILIHCRQGADRTGLAVALYMAALHGADEETAEAQLSLRYGHIPWISAARAMDVTFEAMEPMLGYLKS